MTYQLKDTDWHVYHYNLAKLKTSADVNRYAKYYNRCLDIYITGVGTWPPSIIAVYGSDDIKREDVRALEYATTDAIQDITITARDTHPRHTDFILGSDINRSTEAARIWKEESEENGWPDCLEQLRMGTQVP